MSEATMSAFWDRELRLDELFRAEHGYISGTWMLDYEAHELHLKTSGGCFACASVGHGYVEGMEHTYDPTMNNRSVSLEAIHERLDRDVW
jgi:hypothetical protein